MKKNGIYALASLFVCVLALVFDFEVLSILGGFFFGYFGMDFLINK
jgi:hypothetical protein